MEENARPDSVRTAIVLDPYPMWLEAVRGVLSRVGVEVVRTATTPDEALEAVAALQPDLLVMETEPYAGEHALACLRQGRSLCRDLRCIVLSSCDDRVAVESALQAGAVAYVFKTAHPDDLASVVRQAFEPSVYFAPPLKQAKALPVDEVEPGLLTPRELEILTLLASGSPNADIARNLCVTEQTVKFHLSNIYRKLRVSNRTEAARWAHLRGLATPVERPLSVAL